MSARNPFEALTNEMVYFAKKAAQDETENLRAEARASLVSAHDALARAWIELDGTTPPWLMKGRS